MQIDYQKSVLRDYRRKGANHTLSLRLRNPTRGNIKEECIAICEERFLPKDEQVLRLFFTKKNSREEYVRAIEEYDIEGFRTLQNFLNGKVKNADPKNVELLAWLIDYEPRPYPAYEKKYGILGEEITEEEPEFPEETEDSEEREGRSPEEEEGIAEGESKEGDVEVGRDLTSETEEKETDNIGEEETPIGKEVIPPKRRSSLRLIIIASLVCVLTGGAIYRILFPPPPSPQPIDPKVGCMYWAGDHYEQIPCFRKIGTDTLVIALDMDRLQHFKRITQPDTITGSDKGKVWYVKIDNQLEYYTSPGFHPVLLDRRLKPITDYIINKYIHPPVPVAGN
jgi:hypothetical protein